MSIIISVNPSPPSGHLPKPVVQECQERPGNEQSEGVCQEDSAGGLVSFSRLSLWLSLPHFGGEFASIG